MEIKKLVGWNIRRARQERGLTIEELAHQASLTAPYLGELERGRENVSVVVLDRLAKVLGAKVTDLVGEPAPGARPPKPLRAGRKPR